MTYTNIQNVYIYIGTIIKVHAHLLRNKLCIRSKDDVFYPKKKKSFWCKGGKGDGCQEKNKLSYIKGKAILEETEWLISLEVAHYIIIRLYEIRGYRHVDLWNNQLWQLLSSSLIAFRLVVGSLKENISKKG